MTWRFIKKENALVAEVSTPLLASIPEKIIRNSTTPAHFFNESQRTDDQSTFGMLDVAQRFDDAETLTIQHKKTTWLGVAHLWKGDCSDTETLHSVTESPAQ